jgi:hypothetical protein
MMTTDGSGKDRTARSRGRLGLARFGEGSAASRRDMQHGRDRIRELTARSRLLLPGEAIVADVNTPTTTRGQLGQIAFLEGPPPCPGPVRGLHPQRQEHRLTHLPLKHAKINQVWLATTAIACNLLAWLRLLCLSGDLAKPNARSCATASCTP